MLPIIFLMPLVQMLILVFAATNELRQVDVSIVDLDRSVKSYELVNEIAGNPFFVVHHGTTTLEAEALLMRNRVDLALVIPSGFDSDLTLDKQAEVQVLVDAINGSAAQLSFGYLSAVVNSFNRNVLLESGMLASNEMKQIEVKPSFWYNAQLNYKHYMAPGILVILITVIGMLLGGLNLVREKELGTIEQINVTPIQKWQFIAGKLLPFLVIGLFDLAFGLLVAKVAFQIPIRGSFMYLFGAGAVYLVLVLSAGLFISTISDTQQQATFVSYFMLVVFIMMSGLFTPVESMPQWAQYLDYGNPLYYFVKILRSVILKGSTFTDLLTEMTALSLFAMGMFVMAVWKYRKTA
jgi:ABC-2 type transport system permease protein